MEPHRAAYDLTPPLPRPRRRQRRRLRRRRRRQNDPPIMTPARIRLERHRRGFTLLMHSADSAAGDDRTCELLHEACAAHLRTRRGTRAACRQCWRVAQQFEAMLAHANTQEQARLIVKQIVAMIGSHLLVDPKLQEKSNAVTELLCWR